jgi:transposase
MAERHYGHAPREIRAAAVERYLTSDLTQEEVAEQFGTSKANVSYWVKAAGNQTMKKRRTRAASSVSPLPEPASSSTTPDGRSAKEKLRLLVAASLLSEEQRGEFLRREGLHDGDLERFEAEALGGLGSGPSNPADQRRIQELERVNAKQEKRLHEAEVLLELQKKVQQLWEAKGDSTTKR